MSKTPEPLYRFFITLEVVPGEDYPSSRKKQFKADCKSLRSSIVGKELALNALPTKKPARTKQVGTIAKATVRRTFGAYSFWEASLVILFLLALIAAVTLTFTRGNPALVIVVTCLVGALSLISFFVEVVKGFRTMGVFFAVVAIYSAALSVTTVITETSGIACQTKIESVSSSTAQEEPRLSETQASELVSVCFGLETDYGAKKNSEYNEPR